MALKDEPLQFAAGVDIKSVVKEVLKEEKKLKPRLREKDE